MILLVVAGATAVALGVTSATQRSPSAATAHADKARADEVRARFDQAVAMLHARQWQHAVTSLHRLLELAPDMPEAHANMGFAMAGLENWKVARDFFEGALALDSRQTNAYFGLAMAMDALGDRAAARGAMRTYIHLSPPGDRFVAKARAALWEWESETPPVRETASK